MVVVSSCREVLGQVLQRAQPLSLVAIIKLGTLVRLPTQVERKVGMTSNHHGPYALGYTRATMAGTESSHWVTRSESTKPVTVRIGVCNPTP